MSEEKPRWEEVAGKLAFEKIELDREIERQRMLDELSAARSRNYELEGALAKLARDQDRVALAERERVLKRAQIAQATAVLVQEAQWAKARMESEMRVAKNRAMVFPDISTRRPTVNSRAPQVLVNSVPADSPPTPPHPPMVVPNSAHSSSPDGVIFSKPSFVVDSSSSPTVVAPEAIDSLAAAVAETSKTVMNSAGELGGMLSSAFTDVASMFGNSAEPPKIQNPQIPRALELQVTTNPTSQKLPVIVESTVSGQNDENGANTVSASESTRVNQEVTSVVSEDLSHSSNVNSPLDPKPPAVPKSSEPMAQASTTPFPARSAPTQEGSKKSIQQRAKGAWTNMELHAEAGIVLEQLIEERDSTIQKKPQLIERLFAIPDRSARAHVEYPMQPEWLKIADSWAKSASVEPAGKSGAKSRIDPVIASMAGVDPNLDGQENIKPDQIPPVEVARTPPPVEEPPGDSKTDFGDGKKKKCIIM